jgi:hypothetical protein
MLKITYSKKLRFFKIKQKRIRKKKKRKISIIEKRLEFPKQKSD